MKNHSLQNTVNQTWQQLNPVLRIALPVGLILFIGMLSGSAAALAGPFWLAFFWTLVSADNRTVSLKALLLAGGAGLLLILPVAAVLEAMFIGLSKATAWLALVTVLVELGLLVFGVVEFSVWPQSRLRLTGSIMDFALVGLWLGVGLEAGIGFLLQHPGCCGTVFLIFPAVPGTVIGPDGPAAASSPAVWGLLVGLGVGIGRYLAGPDFRSRWVRVGLGVGAVLLLAGLSGERLAYWQGGAVPWSWLYAADLQGRLLTYAVSVAALIILAAEHLLIKEHDRQGTLAAPFRAWAVAWNSVSGSSRVFHRRVTALLAEQTRRRLSREVLLGHEIRPLLREGDRALLDRRQEQIQPALGQEEIQRELA